MKILEFEEIKEKALAFTHSSMEYTEYEDVAEYTVENVNENLILILGYHKEMKCYEYHWATDHVDILAKHLCSKETFVLPFVPKDWLDQLAAHGLKVRNAWHDYFLSNLNDIDDNSYSDAELLTVHECKEASDVTLASVGQSRGFTGQTPEWIAEWISNKKNADVQNGAIIISRTSEQRINGIVCTGTYAHDSEKGPVVWIREIAVLPPYQNMGIARKLLNQALSYGKKFGAKRAFLAVDEDNTNAIHLYTSIGFKPSDDLSQIDMIKRG